MAVNVAVIGAGSVEFTRTLFRDILAVEELRDTAFAFTDINRQNLRMVTQLCEKDIRANDLPARIRSTLDRREALTDADYVINVSRIGGLEAFALDVEIPLTYGVDQCVGDTLCAGGIMYGQRSAPAILDFCEDIRDVAADGVLLLNYANPNAMNTWVALSHGAVPTVGLCHGVQHGHAQIAAVIELIRNKGKQSGAQSFVPVTADDVHIICAGINHQAWYIQIIYEGEDWTSRLLGGFEKHPVYQKTEKVRIDMLRRFGFWSTESNGHQSEYVPWYRKRRRDIRRWIDRSDWIHGETGGYLRYCREQRDWFKREFPKLLRADSEPIRPEDRSAEHASSIIEALETGRVYRGHFNVLNAGCLTNLPDDAIVEVPGYVDRNGMNIPFIGDLPLGCAAVCNASIAVQRLAVEAAVTGDVTLLKQAMMMDPLVGAVCDPEQIAQMTDEMLVAQARWLPQYKAAIPKARRRLTARRRNPRAGGGADRAGGSARRS